MISKALIFAGGPCIGVSDLALAPPEPARFPSRASGLSLEHSEREMVFKALKETGGHHQRAASLLGISRRTLTRKLKVYGSAEEWRASVA